MNRLIGRKTTGFTLVELMVATALLGMIVTAALSLYLNQQKQWVVQDQIADMQQNVRVAMDELVTKTRMAGCGFFPWGLAPIKSADANPDTFYIRHNPHDCLSAVGKNVLSNTIHTRGDPECFVPGMRAYIWDYVGQSEWFTVGWVDTNEGLGWYEVHSTENLDNLYKAKDNPRIMVFDEYKYYIDHTSDSGHPTLMRVINGLPAQVFAENVEDLQVTYIMNDGTTTSVPDDVLDIKTIHISLQTRTERQDAEWTDQVHGDGYRRRTLASKIDARNLGL